MAYFDGNRMILQVGMTGEEPTEWVTLYEDKNSNYVKFGKQGIFGVLEVSGSLSDTVIVFGDDIKPAYVPSEFYSIELKPFYTNSGDLNPYDKTLTLMDSDASHALATFSGALGHVYYFLYVL